MISKKDINIIKLALVAVIISMSGWAVFEGFKKLFELDTLSPFTLIIGGIISVWLVTKFGLKKLK